MNEANYASLSAGLLARKGQAKPAMRPQNYTFGSADDLGWNDMGGADLLTPEQRLALLPAEPAAAQPRPAFAADASVPSPVAEQQQQIAAAYQPAPLPSATLPPASLPPASLPVVDPVRPQVAIVSVAPIQTAPRPRAAPGSKSKAAFTLRLDPQRHMQLRLACVYSHQSAQQLVTAALDEYLSAHFPDAAGGAGKKTAAN